MKVVVVGGVEGGILVWKAELAGWVEVVRLLVEVLNERDLLAVCDVGGL